MLCRRSVLDEGGVKALLAYKYQSGGCSALDNALNPFWEVVARRLPPWLAPNLVTLSGSLLLAVAFVVTLLHSPDLTSPLPPAVSALSAVCLFLYSTLDAVDGKQARNTGSSSPLGQLFDHGCDALGVTFIMVPFAADLQLGITTASFLLVSSVLVPFFLSQWEEYHTHIIRTHVGIAGVTEGQFILMACHVASAVSAAAAGSPTAFWWSPLVTVAGVAITPATLALTLQAVSLFLATWSFLTNVVVAHGKPAALVHLLPMAAHMAYSLWSLYPVGYASGLPLLYMLTQCFTLSYLTSQIIVYGLCRTPYPLAQPTVALPFVAAAVRAAAPHLLQPVVAATCAVVLMLYASWVVSAMYQLSDVLGIRCFVITRRSE